MNCQHGIVGPCAICYKQRLSDAMGALAAERAKVARLEGVLVAAAKSLEMCGRMFLDVPRNDPGCAAYAANRARVARAALSTPTAESAKEET